MGSHSIFSSPEQRQVCSIAGKLTPYRIITDTLQRSGQLKIDGLFAGINEVGSYIADIPFVAGSIIDIADGAKILPVDGPLFHKVGYDDGYMVASQVRQRT